MPNFPRKQSTTEPRKKPPPVETLAEVFYYRKQIDARTEMVIVLQDGEQITGTIEWYDLDALKINRKDAPNILLPKHSIKYMFKAEDRAAE
jgi:sRNA-binding regulator protein Hfq